MESIQSALNTAMAKHGLGRLFWRPLEVDGAFGPRTRAAVEQAQFALGLPVTGEVDGGTAALLGIVDTTPPWLAIDHQWQGASRKGGPRRQALDTIVLHETVTETGWGAVNVLKRRHLSTHYIVHRDEADTTEVVELMDPIRRAAHAGGAYNDRSIGIDISNRYYGAAGPDEVRIEVPWADKRSYRVQPPEETEAVWLLVEYLTRRYPSIPLAFPGVRDGVFRWRTETKTVAGKPGIISHHRCSSHTDGMFQEHYCYLRSRGIERDEAHARTLESAKRGRSTQVPR